MANTLGTNNTHPLGATGSYGGASGIISLLKGNPIFSALLGLLFLSFILPPRSRKRRYGNHRRSKPISRTIKKPAKRKKGKKSKPVPVVKRSKTRKSITGSRTARPAHMVKGSKAAKEHMAHLRSLRKK